MQSMTKVSEGDNYGDGATVSGDSLALELMHALAVAWSFAVDFFVFDLFRANWVLICLAGVRFP